MAAVAALVGVLPTFGGCSTNAADADVSPSAALESPVDSSDFWSSFHVGALEHNPPRSLSELVDRSDYIFTGKVLAVEPGPVYMSEDGSGVSAPTVALVARADNVLKGDLADTDVKIAMVPAGPVDEAAKAKPPGNRDLFFLVLGSDGYYGLAAIAGLVEEAPNGLVTVADPGQASLVESGTGAERKTFNDLVKEVRQLVE